VHFRFRWKQPITIEACVKSTKQEKRVEHEARTKTLMTTVNSSEREQDNRRGSDGRKMNASLVTRGKQG
jgi:hypothetical protein